MTKHTPAPWVIRYGGLPNDEGFGIACDNATCPGMVAEHWPCTTDAKHRERLLADAKLIAAAPDLLATMKEIYEAVRPNAFEVAPIEEPNLDAPWLPAGLLSKLIKTIERATA